LPDGNGRFDKARFDDFRLGLEVQWLWPSRIPRGMVTLIEGAEGAGKSFVALDIAARVSRRLGWPGLPERPGLSDRNGCGAAQNGEAGSEEASNEMGNEEAGDVLILCRPDDCRCTARRLAALGADFERIRRLKDFGTCEPGENGDARRPPSFPGHLPAIEEELRRGTLRLVVIDSLADFCPLPQQVAETLRRLNELAEEYDVAIVVTLPALSRCDSQGTLKVTSRYRSGGARCVWTILADPDVPARRVFVPRRTNFCEEPAGLEFRFDGGRVVWNPKVRIDPADPLAVQAGVSQCLAEALRDGFRPAAEVLREGHQCGFSPKQMRSAAKRLGIESRKSSGFGADGGWTWWTPEQWALRIARLQALGARSGLATAEPSPHCDGATGHNGTPGSFGNCAIGNGARQMESEAPANGPSSRLVVGPVWVNPDGTISEAVCVRGDEALAQIQARDAARRAASGVTTTTAVPPAGALASPVRPQTPVVPPRAECELPDSPQAASSKNKESMEKQGDFQHSASGPLPRDGYARRQERKRRQRLAKR
jgi:hypothetical protein